MYDDSSHHNEQTKLIKMNVQWSLVDVFCTNIFWGIIVMLKIRSKKLFMYRKLIIHICLKKKIYINQIKLIIHICLKKNI